MTETVVPTFFGRVPQGSTNGTVIADAFLVPHNPQMYSFSNRSVAKLQYLQFNSLGFVSILANANQKADWGRTWEDEFVAGRSSPENSKP
jgi:hypothetical protein